MRDMKINKIWIKQLLELIFIISIIKSNDFINIGELTPIYPWYTILVFLAIISGVSLHAINKDSKEEMRVNMLFLFIKAFLIDIFISRTFDKDSMFLIINDSMNQLFILMIYILCKDPLLNLGARNGKIEVFNLAITITVLFILILLQLSTVIRITIPVAVWLLLTISTFKFKTRE